MCECEGPSDFQSDCQRGLWGGKTNQTDLKELTRKLENWVKIVHLKFWREKVQLLLYIPRLGTTVLLKPVNKDDIFYCISQVKRALWLRKLGYQHPGIGEEDLTMISEGDVFISSSREPLNNSDYKCHSFYLMHLKVGFNTDNVCTCSY